MTKTSKTPSDIAVAANGLILGYRNADGLALLVDEYWAQDRADALANIRGAVNGNGRRARGMVDALIDAGDSELAEARAERAAR